MNANTAMQRIQDQWMTFIMRGDTAAETLAAAEAVVQGGSTMIEVAFTTPDVHTVIAELRRRHDDDLVIAAGTVTTVEQARIAVDSGADVVVSPDVFPEVIKAAKFAGKLSIPGAMTPTEVSTAVRLGADIIKIFPCYVGGPDFIKFLRGPFPGVRTLPAGAVTLQNMADYHRAEAFASVVGVTTELGMLAAVKAGRFQEVTTAIRTWLAEVRAMLKKA